MSRIRMSHSTHEWDTWLLARLYPINKIPLISFEFCMRLCEFIFEYVGKFLLSETYNSNISTLKRCIGFTRVCRRACRQFLKNVTTLAIFSSQGRKTRRREEGQDTFTHDSMTPDIKTKTQWNGYLLPESYCPKYCRDSNPHSGEEGVSVVKRMMMTHKSGCYIAGLVVKQRRLVTGGILFVRMISKSAKGFEYHSKINFVNRLAITHSRSSWKSVEHCSISFWIFPEIFAGHGLLQWWWMCAKFHFQIRPPLNMCCPFHGLTILCIQVSFVYFQSNTFDMFEFN